MNRTSLVVVTAVVSFGLGMLVTSSPRKSQLPVPTVVSEDEGTDILVQPPSSLENPVPAFRVRPVRVYENGTYTNVLDASPSEEWRIESRGGQKIMWGVKVN